jgi:gamma-glutamyltranspeptidase
MYLSITVQMLIPESISINFREKAPALASTNMYINDTSKAAIGGLSVGVPGELMGLYEAYKRFGLSSNERYGTLDWKLLVQPSVKLSRDGWKVGATDYDIF